MKSITHFEPQPQRTSAQRTALAVSNAIAAFLALPDLPHLSDLQPIADRLRAVARRVVAPVRALNNARIERRRALIRFYAERALRLEARRLEAIYDQIGTG